MNNNNHYIVFALVLALMLTSLVKIRLWVQKIWRQFILLSPSTFHLCPEMQTNKIRYSL